MTSNPIAISFPLYGMFIHINNKSDSGQTKDAFSRHVVIQFFAQCLWSFVISESSALEDLYFSEFQLECDQRMDQQTDQRTDGRTYPLIEMGERI